MKTSSAFERILQRVKPENKQFIDKNLDIAQQVRAILKSHPSIKTQKALAHALEKEESEVCKWLSGRHNITLESITKMEIALGQDIILTPESAKAKYSRTQSTKHGWLIQKAIRGVLTVDMNIESAYHVEEANIQIVNEPFVKYATSRPKELPKAKTPPRKGKETEIKEIAF